MRCFTILPNKQFGNIKTTFFLVDDPLGLFQVLYFVSFLQRSYHLISLVAYSNIISTAAAVIPAHLTFEAFDWQFLIMGLCVGVGIKEKHVFLIPYTLQPWC